MLGGKLSTSTAIGIRGSWKGVEIIMNMIDRGLLPAAYPGPWNIKNLTSCGSGGFRPEKGRISVS